MHVTIITAFPGFFADFLSTSMIGRAIQNGLISVDVLDLRDFAPGGYKQVDDYAFGGGGGMVLLPEVLSRALQAAEGDGEESFVVYPSPQGDLLSQEIVETLASKRHVVVICGHYEGLDERFVSSRVDREISVGDFVLTGGEIPAMAVADCLCRMVPGVLPEESCYTDESHWNGLLEYPQYSRPEVWHGRAVPPVLLSGHHGNVDDWRKKESYKRTMRRRPDMFAKFDESQLTTKHDRKILQQAKEELRQEQESAEEV